MGERSIIPALSRWLGKVTELLHAFARWWLKELLALLPARVTQWLVDDGSRALVLIAEEGAVVLQLMNARRRVLASVEVSGPEYKADVIDGFLKFHGLRRDRVSLGVRLPPESFFCRSLVLPLETRRSLNEVVLQDLLNKTPFQPEDIFHAHVARQMADKIAVSQWAVRRSRVNDRIELLGLDPRAVTFVESSHPEANDDLLPSVMLRQPPD